MKIVELMYCGDHEIELKAAIEIKNTVMGKPMTNVRKETTHKLSGKSKFEGLTPEMVAAEFERRAAELRNSVTVTVEALPVPNEDPGPK